MKLYTDQIRKSYRNRNVVDGVSIEVSQGEIVGLLGPNGAGKSSFIKAVLGLVVPVTGSIHIMGKPKRRKTEHIAYNPA